MSVSIRGSWFLLHLFQYRLHHLLYLLYPQRYTVLIDLLSFVLLLLLFFFSGGWTLIGRVIMKDENSVKDEIKRSNSYRKILSKYHSNNQCLLRDGFNQLRKDMGFTQIRFLF